MKRHTVVWIAAAAAALAVLLPLFLARTRYVSQQAGRRERIAVLTRREADVGTSVLFAGMEKAAEDDKLVLNYVMVPADADLETERQLAAQEIEDGASALIIEPVAFEGSGKMAEELSQRAVVVLLGERADTEAAGRFGSVSADNYAIGVRSGEKFGRRRRSEAVMSPCFLRKAHRARWSRDAGAYRKRCAGAIFRCKKRQRERRLSRVLMTARSRRPLRIRSARKSGLWSTGSATRTAISMAWTAATFAL